MVASDALGLGCCSCCSDPTALKSESPSPEPPRLVRPSLLVLSDSRGRLGGAEESASVKGEGRGEVRESRCKDARRRDCWCLHNDTHYSTTRTTVWHALRHVLYDMHHGMTCGRVP